MLNIDLNKLTVDPQQKKLPDKVIICKKCVMTNQRPRIEFDDAGVCSACRYAEKKKDALRQRKKQIQIAKKRGLYNPYIRMTTSNYN